jgi:indole-3-glycerol phosphate synthase
MTILDEILEHKGLEVEQAKTRRASAELALEAKACSRAPLGFREALRSTPGVSVIAEIKRRSPSKGLIREDFDAVAIARAYAAAGAACISVLTDAHFFGGTLDDLAAVRAAVNIPLIRKDFLIDAYQIDEARVVGADAILLIVAALGKSELKGLYDHAQGLGLDVLVEVHDETELEQALAIGSNLIGVNNRDLRTFVVDLSTTERIAARLSDPEVVLVAESGISGVEDVARLERAGAAGFLVGELLMRQPDPGEALDTLRRSS